MVMHKKQIWKTIHKVIKFISCPQFPYIGPGLGLSYLPRAAQAYFLTVYNICWSREVNMIKESYLEPRGVIFPKYKALARYFHDFLRL